MDQRRFPAGRFTQLQKHESLETVVLNLKHRLLLYSCILYCCAACTHTHTLTDFGAHTGTLAYLYTHTSCIWGILNNYHTSTTGTHQRHRNPLANWFKHLHTNPTQP